MTFGRKKLFVDIDGVLLTTKSTKPADYSVEFIDYILDNFHCYWLTTHCKGNTSATLKYLAMYFDKNVVQRLQDINPTNWTTLKTEVFDFSTDFLWLDDYPFEAEKNILATNNSLRNLIIVDLNQKDELKRVINALEAYTHQLPDFKQNKT